MKCQSILFYFLFLILVVPYYVVDFHKMGLSELPF